MPNRKQYLIANWKMSKTTNQAILFMQQFSVNSLNNSEIQVILAPSYVSLSILRDIILTASAPITLAAQNCSSEESGAYTGEVSVTMLREIGCQYVIIGHSERRTLFGECEPILSKKVELAVKAGLIPILCIGESRELYETGATVEYLKQQLAPYSSTLPFLLAYEPIWSIGTGLIPTREDLSTALDAIDSKFPDTPILYGGSVNRKNISDLLWHQRMNGFLVGGASLEPDSFFALYSAMNQNNHHG